MTHSHDTATPALSVESAAGISIEALQAAHVARQEEWCPDQKPDLSFRGNEMAGEVGEACNVIKKLERERQGWRGSRATVDDLGDELADVIHTAILCSITAGIELGPRVIAKFNATSEKNGLATTLAAAPAPNPSLAAKGGEAEARFDYLSDAQARELFGTEDDDELPDGRVRVCAGEWVRIPGGYYFDASAGLLHPETASEACDGCAVTITPTEGPASQTEGMGGDATKLRENIEAFLEMHRRGVLTPRTPNIPIELLQKALAALTQPETAEAVPPLYLIRKGGAFYRPNSQGYTRSIAEAGRYSLAEAEAITHPNGPNGPRDGMDYIPAPALASDPAPATDDRERLVEALRELTEACEADCGMPDEWDDDNEPVGASAERPMALTFGILRRARAALATEASR